MQGTDDTYRASGSTDRAVIPGVPPAQVVPISERPGVSCPRARPAIPKGQSSGQC
jgi:hypothetical protein